MISTVRSLLIESVRLRLRSDVPLAVYLSGGIDSAAIAGIATHLLREKDPNAKVTAFTLAYIGEQKTATSMHIVSPFSEDEITDESPIAARTANHLGAEIKLVNATESALVATFEESIWHTEMPNTTFHSAGKMLLSKAVRSNRYKVLISFVQPQLFLYFRSRSFSPEKVQMRYSAVTAGFHSTTCEDPTPPLLVWEYLCLLTWNASICLPSSNVRLGFPNSRPRM
jgi:hypothetical protein